jgi:dCTP deaminase
MFPLQNDKQVNMGVLIKKDITERIKKGDLNFSPQLDTFQLQMHSVDLRIGMTFLIPKAWKLTEKGREAIKVDHLSGSREHFDVLELEEGQYFELLPNEFVIVSTLETVTMPDDLMGILYPRSSVNRQGLSVELSGIIDAGYKGTLIIPVRNNMPSQVIRIYPGERFCQIVFHTLNEDVEVSLSRYHEKDISQGVLEEKNKKEVAMIKAGKLVQLKKDYSIMQDKKK